MLAGCASAPTSATLFQQGGAALQGNAGPKGLVVSGQGTGTTFRQAWRPTMAWPRLNYSLLKRSYKLETGAFAEEFACSRRAPGLQPEATTPRPVSAPTLARPSTP